MLGQRGQGRTSDSRKGLQGEIQPGDPRATPRERDRLGAEVTLQMEDVASVRLRSATDQFAHRWVRTSALMLSCHHPQAVDSCSRFVDKVE
jgi:hypothetical protein